MKESSYSKYSIFWTFFRIAIVIVIIYFLFHSRAINIVTLIKMFNSGWALLGFICILVAVFFAMIRWKILMNAIKLNPTVFQITKLTFIGFAFNTVIPGAVSGDIVKAYYLSRGRPHKTEAVMTIVFDRLVGIFTLFLTTLSVIVVILLFRNSFIITAEELYNIQIMGLIMLVLVVVIILGFYISLSNRFDQLSIVKRLQDKGPIFISISKLFNTLRLFRYKKRFVFLAIGVSIVGQFPLILSIYFFGKSAADNVLLFFHYLFLAPIAFTLNAIPLSPGGFGSGEIFVYKLFKLFGSINGANILAMFHVSTIVFSFIGLLLYIFNKKNIY